MDAVLGRQTITEEQVVNPVHPPLIVTEKLKANQGTLLAGLILADDSNGEKVAYNPGGVAPTNVPVGVLVRSIDTAKDTAGEVLRHGVAVRSRLKVGAGAPTGADIKKLEAATIFAW